MRTEELVAELSHAPPRPARRLDRGMGIAILLGAALVSGIGLFISVGWRPDLARAVVDPRFQFKLAIAFAVTVAGALASRRTMQPQLEPLWGRWLLPILAVAAAGAAFDLLGGAQAGWRRALPGRQTIDCLLLAAACSALPTIAAVHAMKRGAPASPAAAGAAAGLLGGGLGLSVYVLHCPMDAPVFVAVWYLAAVTLVAMAASVAGRRALAW